MKKIYFAGSIRGGRGDASRYNALIAYIGTLAEVLTEHVGAASVSDMGEQERTDHWIHSRDMEWLRSSDAVIAEVTTPSLGVGYEIGKAEALGKPVLCLFNQDHEFSLSAMISGNQAVTVKRYRTLSQAREAIRGFIDGIGT